MASENIPLSSKPMTEEMRNEGVTILGEPRRTGDGYYESIIEEPEGNIIEIVSENS